MDNTVPKSQPVPEGYHPSQPLIMTLAQNTLAPATLQQLEAVAMRGDEPPRMNKIANIRRLWYEDKSENFNLEGCLTSVMKAVGASPEYTYAFFVAACGSVFTQIYNPHERVDSGLTTLFMPELVVHVIRLCGYESLYVDADTIRQHPQAVLQAVKAYVDRGIPVISAGMGNVPLKEGIYEAISEWCQIGGYEGENILFVNTFHEDTVTDEYGYLTVPDGLSHSKGLFFIGEQVEVPSIQAAYEKIFRSIPLFLTLNPVGDFCFGRQAFAQWADTLENDALYEGKTDEELDSICWKTHMAPWVVNCTSSYFLMRSGFKEHIKALCPDLTLFDKILEAYDGKIFLDLNPFHDGDFFIKLEDFKKASLRHDIAAYIRKHCDYVDELLKIFENDEP